MLNSSKSCRAQVRDFSEPLRISVVSSAYWLILISFPLIKIPSISLFVLIPSANISTQIRKMNGERGQPCLTPLSSAKKLLADPLFKTQLSIF